LVKYLPVLATGLVLASWAVLLVELRLFTPISSRYVSIRHFAASQ
jgi:hypothetical protein